LDMRKLFSMFRSARTNTKVSRLARQRIDRYATSILVSWMLDHGGQTVL
jgi:hypothetical protein